MDQSYVNNIFSNVMFFLRYVEILEKTREKYGVDSFKFDAGEINYLTAITDFQTHEEIVNIGKFTSDYAECAYRYKL